nr:hypothetical protein [uncultured Draconibacterium sp.]
MEKSTPASEEKNTGAEEKKEHELYEQACALRSLAYNVLIHRELPKGNEIQKENKKDTIWHRLKKILDIYFLM